MRLADGRILGAGCRDVSLAETLHASVRQTSRTHGRSRGPTVVNSLLPPGAILSAMTRIPKGGHKPPSYLERISDGAP